MNINAKGDENANDAMETNDIDSNNINLYLPLLTANS